jgi:hypothetical protein
MDKEQRESLWIDWKTALAKLADDASVSAIEREVRKQQLQRDGKNVIGRREQKHVHMRVK